MQEIWVQSLGQEVPLEEEMATHSSILAWKTAQKEESDRLQSMGPQSEWPWLKDWACNPKKSKVNPEDLHLHHKQVQEPLPLSMDILKLYISSNLCFQVSEISFIRHCLFFTLSLLLLTSHLSLRADSQCAEQVRGPDTLRTVSKRYLLHPVC